MTLDEPSVTYPRLGARGAALYQCGNAILEHCVTHCGGKRRLDMRISRGESRPAVGANPSGCASTAMQVSIGTTGRHAVSGAGAAPIQLIIIGIVLYIKTAVLIFLRMARRNISKTCETTASPIIAGGRSGIGSSIY